jgi:cytochrome c
MLKFLKPSILALALFLSAVGLATAQDAAKGEKVFKKCKACHAVGDGAKNKVGPQLNDVFGRVAGSIEGFKYSKNMKIAGDEGLVWNDETMHQFLTKPKKMIKKTRMSFAGLKKQKDRDNLIAYLKTFSSESTETAGEEAPVVEPVMEKSNAADEVGKPEPAAEVATTTATAAKDVVVPKHGIFHLGRKALDAEISAWDIDIRPDGKGLPEGKGTVAQGEPIYTDNCAVCHGDFGEGKDRWPVLAGGQDTLTEERPEKTIGSYWPYLSTVFDYVNRAMPFGNARSLSNDDVYALTAYLLYLNDIVDDEEFELSKSNFGEIRLPNEENFIADNRNDEPQYSIATEPCMTDCQQGLAQVTMRARVLDVTPDADVDDGAGSIE